VLRRLTLVVVVLAVLAAAAEYGSRRVAESELAARGRRATGAQSATASVAPFPFLYHLVGRADVPEIDLHMYGVPVTLLRLDHVDVSLADVGVSRSDLFRQRRVRVTSISRASLSATMTAANLSSATGATVAISSTGQVTAEVGGISAQASLTITSQHVLVLSAAGRALLRIDLAANRLMPGCSMSLAFSSDAATATCVMSPVPPSVLAAVQR